MITLLRIPSSIITRDERLNWGRKRSFYIFHFKRFLLVVAAVIFFLCSDHVVIICVWGEMGDDLILLGYSTTFKSLGSGLFAIVAEFNIINYVYFFFLSVSCAYLKFKFDSRKIREKTSSASSQCSLFLYIIFFFLQNGGWGWLWNCKEGWKNVYEFFICFEKSRWVWTVFFC